MGIFDHDNIGFDADFREHFRDNLKDMENRLTDSLMEEADLMANGETTENGKSLENIRISRFINSVYHGRQQA